MSKDFSHLEIPDSETAEMVDSDIGGILARFELAVATYHTRWTRKNAEESFMVLHYERMTAYRRLKSLVAKASNQPTKADKENDK